MLVPVKKPIRDCEEGEYIDLQPWFEANHSSAYIASIEQSFEEYQEGDWHNDDNPGCDYNNEEVDENAECSCQEPKADLVAHGKVWEAIKDEMVEIKSIDFSWDGETANLTIDYDYVANDVPQTLTEFCIAAEFVVETDQYEEKEEETNTQQQSNGAVPDRGPLQPPKDFTRGMTWE